jgi:Disulphide bond corrector protein DsbC
VRLYVCAGQYPTSISGGASRPAGERDGDVRATVFRGRGGFAFRLETDGAAFSGERAAPATLRYQICNDLTNVCYPPQTTEIPLKVVDRLGNIVGGGSGYRDWGAPAAHQLIVSLLAQRGGASDGNRAHGGVAQCRSGQCRAIASRSSRIGSRPSRRVVCRCLPTMKPVIPGITRTPSYSKLSNSVAKAVLLIRVLRAVCPRFKMSCQTLRSGLSSPSLKAAGPQRFGRSRTASMHESNNRRTVIWLFPSKHSTRPRGSMHRHNSFLEKKSREATYSSPSQVLPQPGRHQAQSIAVQHGEISRQDQSPNEDHQHPTSHFDRA